MENERRLYLFDGQTYITVPESAWLNELKSNPFGSTVIKSAQEPFLAKGWVKIRDSRDSNSHASEIEWLYEATGQRMVVSVDRDGQLRVDGNPIGSTTIGETFKAVERKAEEGKWISKIAPDGGRKPIFIPADKVRKPEGFYPGMNTRTPENMTNSTATAMSQVIGKYESPAVVPTPEEIIRNCNDMIALAQKEESVEKRQKILSDIDKQLKLYEETNKAFPSDVKAAISEEAMGSKNYAHMAANAPDPQMKQILQGMSQDEAGHKKKLEQMARRLD